MSWKTSQTFHFGHKELESLNLRNFFCQALTFHALWAKALGLGQNNLPRSGLELHSTGRNGAERERKRGCVTKEECFARSEGRMSSTRKTRNQRFRRYGNDNRDKWRRHTAKDSQYCANAARKIYRLVNVGLLQGAIRGLVWQHENWKRMRSPDSYWNEWADGERRSLCVWNVRYTPGVSLHHWIFRSSIPLS